MNTALAEPGRSAKSTRRVPTIYSGTTCEGSNGSQSQRLSSRRTTLCLVADSSKLARNTVFLICSTAWAIASAMPLFLLEQRKNGFPFVAGCTDYTPTHREECADPVFPILGVFRLKGQPKRDGSVIVRSCKASQSPVYPIRDAFAVVEHPSCPSSSSLCPLPVG